MVQRTFENNFRSPVTSYDFRVRSLSPYKQRITRDLTCELTVIIITTRSWPRRRVLADKFRRIGSEKAETLTRSSLPALVIGIRIGYVTNGRNAEEYLRSSTRGSVRLIVGGLVAVVAVEIVSS